MTTVIDRIGDIEQELSTLRALPKPTRADFQRVSVLGGEACALVRETCTAYDQRLAEGERATATPAPAAQHLAQRSTAVEVLNALVLKYAGTGEIHRDLVQALERVRGDAGGQGEDGTRPGLQLMWAGGAKSRHPSRGKPPWER